MFKRFHPFVKHRCLGILCLISLSLCLWIGHLPGTVKLVEWGQAVTAQTPDASQQVQQGIERYQVQDYLGAIAIWENALKQAQNANNPINKAIILGNLAKAYQQVGQNDKAINVWEQLISYYRQAGNWQKVGRLLTEQAQAYIQQGKNRQAIALLCNSPTTECLPGTALAIARQQKDQLTQVAALGSLGEAYRLRGKYEQAICYLKTAQKLDPSAYQFSLLHSLGNTYLAIAQRWDGIAQSAEQSKAIITAKFQDNARHNYQQSLDYFKQSLNLAYQEKERVRQMELLLNLIQVSYHSTRFNLVSQIEFNQTVEKAFTLLEQLPNSPLKAKVAVELANLPDREIEITTSITQSCPQRYLSDGEA